MDSGYTGNFLNKRVAAAMRIHVQKKKHLYRLYGFDDKPLAENEEMITHKTLPLPMRIGHHYEEISFDIVASSAYNATVGLLWLKKYNPTIDYAKREMVFNKCTCSRPKEREETYEESEIKKISMAAITRKYRENPDSVYLAMLTTEQNPVKFAIL